MHLIDAVRGPLTAVSLLVLSLYLPLAAMIYTPQWYTFQCDWIEKCRTAEHFEPRAAAEELTTFFRHDGKLEEQPWSDKEKRHLTEVRGIWDGLAVTALIFAMVLVFLFRIRVAGRAALINAVVLVVLAAGVLPFFKTFWVDFLHPLVFDNDLWSNSREDLSWYFLPKPFFRSSIAAMVGTAIAIDLALAWFLRPRRRGLFR
ncbi:Protein of unknown function [Thiohalospira halophila DSM 15071]|uniref:Integral membrane protein TIGR01906 n=1 Tax=Thiohalospira halophila DSM 15071 TaxID=1123397 RepID=A0A1I1WAI8_9GAMM|nr:DUF1461 domain-containing protein [Thiohalospira halophila]SFD92051.1 Protein of unknown function [Thiohalospira halophila DSM 15071]